MQGGPIHSPFSFSLSKCERECGSHRLSLLVGLKFRAVQDAAREVPLRISQYVWSVNVGCVEEKGQDVRK